MRDIAAIEFGAKMSQASSHHSHFLPKNILDREVPRPWISTGLYPQFFVLTFPDPMQIHSVDLKSYNVQVITLERCMSDPAGTFEPICEKRLSQTEGKLQVENLTIDEAPAKHLKFTIKSGFDSFCAVYGVTVMGSTLGGRSPMPVRKANVAKMLTVLDEDIPQPAAAPRMTLDVVDSDVYPRHIALNNDADDDASSNSKPKRFQSAFKVPAVKTITQSKNFQDSDDDRSGNLDLNWKEEDDDGDAEDDEDLDSNRKMEAQRINSYWD